jgi:hypothetical protein
MPLRPSRPRKAQNARLGRSAVPVPTDRSVTGSCRPASRPEPDRPPESRPESLRLNTAPPPSLVLLRIPLGLVASMVLARPAVGIVTATRDVPSCGRPFGRDPRIANQRPPAGVSFRCRRAGIWRGYSRTLASARNSGGKLLRKRAPCTHHHNMCNVHLDKAHS